MLDAARLQTAIDHHMAGRLDAAESLYETLLQEESDNTTALCLRGVLAQQKGDLDTALGYMRKAVTLNPENPVILRALADALRELRQFAESADFYEAALHYEPGDQAARFNYATALQQLRRFDAAVRCYEEILKVHPDHVEAHNDMGVALLALQRYDAAAPCFERALALRPDYWEAHSNLGLAHKNRDNLDAAVACYLAALQYKPDHAKALLNLGIIHSLRKQHDEAEKWYRRSLAADPDQVEAHQNLALILAEKGLQEEAQQHRDCAYGKQSIFIDSVENPLKTVVVLWAAGKGNIPIEHLWPKQFYTRICCIMEYVSDAQMRDLPDYDLVFNAIGDPDVTGPTDAAVKRFQSINTKPFLNPPQNITDTARDRIATLFAPIARVVCAPTLRSATATFKDAVLRSKELQFPIIVRPAGSHGGDHLVKVDSPEELQNLALFNAPAYYASNYVNYASADGYFRKYRIAYVNRRAFPYHLAISKHWIVHYKSADMRSEPWKLAEETAFLKNPRAFLGDPAMDALEAIGRTMDLDFCGVDFTLLPDGRVLVFEANATMLIHGEDADGVLQHKNLYVQNIFDAFNRRVAEITQIPGR